MCEGKLTVDLFASIKSSSFRVYFVDRNQLSVLMLAFLRRIVSNTQAPEAMKVVAEFVQQELQANKVCLSSDTCVHLLL